MLSAAVFASVVSLGAGAQIQAGDHTIAAVSDERIRHVNSLQTTWTAGRPSRFNNATVADLKRMLGTFLPHEDGAPDYVPPEKTAAMFTTADSDIPEAFDVRTNWPECAAISGMVRDQSNCGSCWAFGSTEAFNDRHCIATGDTKSILSPEDTLECCYMNSKGCSGGYISGAWRWFKLEGVSTGGNYEDIGKGTTCKPYSMQSCAHHTDDVPAGYVPCEDVPDYSTPKCATSCSEPDYPTPYASEKLKAKSEYSIRGESNMQKELMEKGSLSAGFTVYEDFPEYTSGVYHHVTGRKLGGHAIKIVGWGVDAGVPYWTCINSWNDIWGEQGSFRIQRGECGIEDDVVAGDV